MKKHLIDFLSWQLVKHINNYRSSKCCRFGVEYLQKIKSNVKYLKANQINLVNKLQQLN